MKPLFAALVLPLALAANVEPPTAENPPSRFERWFDGAAKQTDEALEAWTEENYAEARQQLDRALTIEPEDPVARYNAGTGRLADGDLEAARELLHPEDAADAVLSADASFNLGNGLLDRGDLESAISAYEEALRRNPDHGDAKYNLELALRQQQEQEKNEQHNEEDPEQNPEENPNSPSGPDGTDQEDSGNNQPEQPPQDPPEQPSESPQSQEPNSDDTEPDPTSESQPDEPGSSDPPPPSRLPSFEDQEDMTAEQAAALLEAVENLEQQQRAQMAEDERAQRAVDLQVEKDW